MAQFDGVPVWARRFDATGSGVEELTDNVTLSDRSVIVCGTTASTGTTIDLASGAVGETIDAVTMQGGVFGVLMRYDSSGNIMWFRCCPSITFMQMCVDNSDNIYVIGSITATSSNLMTNAYNGDLSTPFTATKNASSSNDGIVIKLTQFGKFIWSRVVQGAGFEEGRSIAVDQNANIYTAFFTNSANASNSIILTQNAVGETVGTLSSVNKPEGSSSGGLIVKYSANGTLQWVRLIEGTTSASDIIFDINVSSDGSVYGVGLTNTSGVLSLMAFAAGGDTTSIPVFDVAKVNTNSGNQGGFIFKYNSNGKPEWIRQIDGLSIEAAYNIKIDNSGNPIVLARIDSTASINLGSGAQGGDSINQLIRKPTTTVVQASLAIIKYTSNGGFTWVRWIDRSPTAEIPTGLTFDEENSIYISVRIDDNTSSSYNLSSSSIGGTSSSSWPFTSYTKTVAGGQGTNNSLIIKYTSDGIPKWIRHVSVYGFFSKLSYGKRINGIGSLYYTGYHSSSDTTPGGTILNLATNSLGGNTNFTFNITRLNSTVGSFLIKFTTLSGTYVEPGGDDEEDSSGYIFRIIPAQAKFKIYDLVIKA